LGTKLNQPITKLLPVQLTPVAAKPNTLCTLVFNNGND
jgi:hypothetical protein